MSRGLVDRGLGIVAKTLIVGGVVLGIFSTLMIVLQALGGALR